MILWDGRHISGMEETARSMKNGSIKFFVAISRALADHRCAVPRCKGKPAIIDRGVQLCDKHYEKECVRNDKVAARLADKLIKRRTSKRPC